MAGGKDGKISTGTGNGRIAKNQNAGKLGKPLKTMNSGQGAK